MDAVRSTCSSPNHGEGPRILSQLSLPNGVGSGSLLVFVMTIISDSSLLSSLRWVGNFQTILGTMMVQVSCKGIVRYLEINLPPESRRFRNQAYINQDTRRLGRSHGEGAEVLQPQQLLADLLGGGGRLYSWASHCEVRSRNQRFGPMILEKSASPSEVGGWAKEILKIQRPKGALYCVVS